MNIEEIKVSLFANPASYSSVPKPLMEVVRMMKYDTILRERTEQYRKTMEAMGKKTANKNIKEKLVSAFSVAVTFRGLGHSNEQAQGFTGLAHCDIDGIDDPDELELAFNRLKNDPHVLIMYRTISGKGLRIIYWYARENDQKIDDTSWRAAFLIGNEQLSLLAGHEYDKNCSDFTRLSGMAYDANLHVNPGAQPYVVPDDIIVEENCEYQEHGRKRKVYAPDTNHADIEEAWQRVDPMMTEKGFSWEPHHHHDYVLHAAYLFNRYGVDEDKLIEWATQEWADYDSKERESAIHHEYKATDKHGTWKLKKMPKAHDNSMADLPEIRKWLDERYQVQYNLVTDQMLYCEKQSLEPWKMVDKIAINTMRVKMAIDTGKRVLTQDIKSVVESDFAELVHPIRDYIRELPKWDGKDRVAEVAAHVYIDATAMSLTDEEGKCLFVDRLKRWLVGTVAGWCDDDACNQEVLTLIGPQGIYKTTFFRFILPPPLHCYFWENTHNSFASKDDRIALTENCLVDIEEIEAIEGKDMEELKGLITSPSIKERRPYAIFREQKHRLASFCATGNRQHILTDLSGTRRWFCFMVRMIDDPHQWNLDYEQLYAQLYHEYQQGYRYYLSKQEEEELNTLNAPFKFATSEEELIVSRFRKPKGNEHFQWMSASMIAMVLVGGVNRGLDTKKIAEVMKLKKYKTKRSGGYTYYKVADLTPLQQQSEILENDDSKKTQSQSSQLPDIQEQALPF